jgi:hypothetical protein
MSEPYDTGGVNPSIDMLVSDLRAAKDEVMLITMDRDIWRQRAESKMSIWRETLEKLEDFTVHEMPCPLAQWSQGRPTKDGGYETMYGGKWYQGDEKPACTCGLDAALSAAKELLEVGK